MPMSSADTGPDRKPATPPGKGPESAPRSGSEVARARRQAEALRQNLRRRKAKATASAADTPNADTPARKDS